MKAKVLVRKVNDGMTFEVQPPRARTHLKPEQYRTAIRLAMTWWEEAVSVAATRIFSAEVAERFRQEVLRAQLRINGPLGHLPLEPWGWVVNGQMSNTGSTPTDARARKLLAYQAPLYEVRRGPWVSFEHEIEVDVSSRDAVQRRMQAGFDTRRPG